MVDRPVRQATRLAALLALALLHISCSDKGAVLPPAKLEEKAPPRVVVDNTPVNHGLAVLAQQQLAQALQASMLFNQTTEHLLRAADLNSLTAAQHAWHGAAKRIEAFYVFSRLGSLSTSAHSYLANQQYNIAAWPIAPGYLDAYGEHPYSGLVFEAGLPLSASLLRQQHGMTAQSDAALGIYAIEYILFGENNDRRPSVFQPITELSDQDQATGYQKVEELPGNRRRQLLQLQTSLLLEDVRQLQQYWETHQPPVRDADFKLAALTMTTEQIIEAAQLQKPKTDESLQQRLKRGQQLAERMGAQLAGWQQGLGLLEMPNRADLILISQNAIDRLQIISSQRTAQPLAIAHDIKAQRSQWQLVYQDLRNLAIALTPPSTTVEVSENEAGSPTDSHTHVKEGANPEAG